MVTVNGNLISVCTTDTPGGTIDFQLCGYGSRTPQARASAPEAGNICEPFKGDIEGAPSGNTFSVDLIGNDVIQPPGTYYVATTRNANGDIVQCDAYTFYESHGNYDLTTEDPFDPGQQPPPPIPPIISDLLEIVPPADNMVFDGSAYTAFKTTLNGNVTQPVFENMTAGNLYTFIVVQDGTGGRSFNWAANVKNAMPVCLDPGSTSVQTFVADEFGNLLAISAGTYQ